MKKILLLAGLLPLIGLFMANKSGSQGGYSGSPGDNNNSCVKCHGGSGTDVSGWITSDIPETGYIQGTTYRITLTATDSAASRFGFELTAEDASNSKIGVFTVVNSAETRLTNNGKSVTHTSSGVDPTDFSRTWSFDWLAPGDPVGDISFYAAVNAANGNGNSSGDKIYLTNINYIQSVTGINDRFFSFSFFPNPSKGPLNVNIPVLENDCSLSIINMLGQTIEKINIRQGLNYFDLNYLPKGKYILQIPELPGFEPKLLILY